MKYCTHCGKEVMDEAIICPTCGCPVKADGLDVPDTGLNILALLFPLIGLILYLVYHNKAPKRAKAVGKFSLIGFCVSLLLVVCASAYINYESPQERARREINESTARVQEAQNRLDDLQRQRDYMQGLIDRYEKGVG